MNVAIETAFFTLKSAQSYRFYKRLGVAMVDVKKGQVITTKTKDDAAYFRARPDVMSECNEIGTPLTLLGQGEINEGKAKTYKHYGRHRPQPQPPAAQPVAPSGTPSQTPAPPKVPGAAVYKGTPGTSVVGANPDHVNSLPPIPADPLAGVALPEPQAPEVPMAVGKPLETKTLTADAEEKSVIETARAIDPYDGMSHEQKQVIQKQRISSGMAPDPRLPIPPENADPMVAALESQLRVDPGNKVLESLLMTAKQNELVKLQQVVGALPAASAKVDVHAQPETARGSLLAELQAEQQTGRMDTPIEFASADGSIESTSGRTL